MLWQLEGSAGVSTENGRLKRQAWSEDSTGVWHMECSTSLWWFLILFCFLLLVCLFAVFRLFVVLLLLPGCCFLLFHQLCRPQRHCFHAARPGIPATPKTRSASWLRPQGSAGDTPYRWWAGLPSALPPLRWCSMSPILIQYTQGTYHAPYWRQSNTLHPALGRSRSRQDEEFHTTLMGFEPTKFRRSPKR